MRRILLIGICIGCAPRTRIVVPPDALREASYAPDARAARHVIRMSDGTRDWEVEFPDVATGYEVRIPLRGNPADSRPTTTAHVTAADREMIEEKAIEPAAVDAKGKKTDAKKKNRPSYLAGIAHVRELYRTRNYELALIECVDLEREYPDDEKILEMKGSIYKKLGKPRLARATWERVLSLNPDNTIVADALRELGEPETDDDGGR